MIFTFNVTASDSLTDLADVYWPLNHSSRMLALFPNLKSLNVKGFVIQHTHHTAAFGDSDFQETFSREAPSLITGQGLGSDFPHPGPQAESMSSSSRHGAPIHAAESSEPRQQRDNGPARQQTADRQRLQLTPTRDAACSSWYSTTAWLPEPPWCCREQLRSAPLLQETSAREFSPATVCHIRIKTHIHIYGKAIWYL
uniref:Uncharacterized protein n=1 Tax=Geospiza parvula TaxID=87175 RepID=A0A8U8AXA6_GEOPR